MCTRVCMAVHECVCVCKVCAHRWARADMAPLWGDIPSTLQCQLHSSPRPRPSLALQLLLGETRVPELCSRQVNNRGAGPQLLCFSAPALSLCSGIRDLTSVAGGTDALLPSRSADPAGLMPYRPQPMHGTAGSALPPAGTLACMWQGQRWGRKEGCGGVITKRISLMPWRSRTPLKPQTGNPTSCTMGHVLLPQGWAQE